jgi:ribose-phosphate pyrophosphokinase
MPKKITVPPVGKAARAKPDRTDFGNSNLAKSIKIFTGNANPALAQSIADLLGIPLGKALVSKFTNNETRVKIDDSVRGLQTFVIQPTCTPVNDNLMELLIIIDALRRASAQNIIAVIPYYGYAKQEKKVAPREPISAKLVANLISVAGARRVITVDLHSAAIQGFFDIPVDNLYALPIIVNHLRNRRLFGKNTVVVSPDAGGVARARAYAEKLDASLAIIFKRHPQPEVAEIIEIVGNVKGKTAFIVDDMISTGGTLLRAAQALIQKGARDVYAAITHPILAGNAINRILDSPLKEIVVTDTVPMPKSALGGKFTQLSVAPLLAETIRRIHFNLSVSELFE